MGRIARCELTLKSMPPPTTTSRPSRRVNSKRNRHNFCGHFGKNWYVRRRPAPQKRLETPDADLYRRPDVRGPQVCLRCPGAAASPPPPFRLIEGRLSTET